MVKKIKGKFYNVFIFCVLKMRRVQELQFCLQMAEEFDNTILTHKKPQIYSFLTKNFIIL